MYVLLYCGVYTGVRLLSPGENPIAVVVVVVVVICLYSTPGPIKIAVRAVQK
jgi:hypothetical protein